MEPALLSEQVYAHLFDALVTQRLAPGDHLNRRQVAEDLGVSVAPVLEALTQLEWEGFVETSPRRGTVVRRITARHVHGRFRLRQAIEAEAARLYAGEPIRRRMPQLLEAAHEVDAIMPTTPTPPRDPDGRAANARAEIDFHGMLVDLADCPVLSEEFRRVMRHGLYHAALLMELRPLQIAPGMHRHLVEALAGATPDEAERLIRAHLSGWMANLVEAERIESANGSADTGRGRPRTLKPRRSRRSSAAGRRAKT